MIRDLDIPSALVLTQDEATAVAERIRRFVTVERFNLQLYHTVQAVTRVANGRVLLNSDGETLQLGITLSDGTAGAGTMLNQLDDNSLRAAVRHVEMVLRAMPSFGTPQPRVTEPVAMSTEAPLWKSATAMAIAGDLPVRETALPALIDPVTASSFSAAAVLGLKARSTYIMHSTGLVAYQRETDALCSVRARSRDGMSTGWAGKADRDWSLIDPGGIAREAVVVAEQARNPVALEPGRRTVILSATAFGQLVAKLAPLFNAAGADQGTTPFGSARRGGTRLGSRVVDARFRLSSAPQDASIGHLPFYGDPRDFGQIDIYPGLPLDPITWIEGGRLTNLAYGVQYGASQGKRYNRYPHAIAVSPMPGTPTASVAEMIASCAEGIYVTRFARPLLLDGPSGTMTGTTQDGCFLVKNGKITKSLRNFRFLESPLFVMNRLEAIGVPQRIVDTDLLEVNASFPVMAPPVLVRDFNFSALSDAI